MKVRARKSNRRETEILYDKKIRDADCVRYENFLLLPRYLERLLEVKRFREEASMGNSRFTWDEQTLQIVRTNSESTACRSVK